MIETSNDENKKKIKGMVDEDVLEEIKATKSAGAKVLLEKISQL
jgi:hypothetical protein